MKWWRVGAAIQANATGRQCCAMARLLLLDVIAADAGPGDHGWPGRARDRAQQPPSPMAKAQDFTTFKDGQTAMAIHVRAGRARVWSANADPWRALSCAASRPWRRARRASASRFQVDADGLLSVSAQASWARASRRPFTVKPSYGLADEQIAQHARRTALPTAEADMQAARSLREAQRRSRAHGVGDAFAALAADAGPAGRRRGTRRHCPVAHLPWTEVCASWRATAHAIEAAVEGAGRGNRSLCSCAA